MALAALVSNHADNKMHATTLSVFQQMRGVLANHEREPGVNEAVARFLLYFMVDRLLVRGTTFKAVVVNEGFAVHLVEMMQHNIAAPEVTHPRTPHAPPGSP